MRLFMNDPYLCEVLSERRMREAKKKGYKWLTYARMTGVRWMLIYEMAAIHGLRRDGALHTRRAEIRKYIARWRVAERYRDLRNTVELKQQLLLKTYIRNEVIPREQSRRSAFEIETEAGARPRKKTR